MRHLVADGPAGPDSRLASLDPRAKIVAVAGALLVVVSEPRTAVAPFAAYVVLVGLLLALGRVPVRRLVQRLLLAAPVVAAAAVFLALAPRTGGVGGPTAATAMSLKAATAVALATLLVSIERLHRIVAGLAALGMPAGLAAVATYMYRYGFVLADEAVRTTRARVSRTPGRLRGGRVRVYGRQAAVIFVRGWRRARRVHQAMVSRGFDRIAGGAPPMRLAAADVAFTVAVVGAFAAVRLAWPWS